MTATLTPVETIFDDLTIMGLEKHWDDDVICQGTGCSRPATLRSTMRCCPTSYVACEPCLHLTLAIWRVWLKGKGVSCNNCNHRYHDPQTVRDIAEVGDL